VFQDAREVRTKFSKSFKTIFVEFEADVRAAFDQWVNYLQVKKLWGPDDPLFPSTKVLLDNNQEFFAGGVVAFIGAPQRRSVKYSGALLNAWEFPTLVCTAFGIC